MCLKRDGYTCCVCGKKQTKVKGREVAIEVHHIDGVIDWERLIDIVYEQLLTGPDRLQTLCKECHSKIKENA